MQSSPRLRFNSAAVNQALRQKSHSAYEQTPWEFRFHSSGGKHLSSQHNQQAQADNDEVQNISFSENIDESPMKMDEHIKGPNSYQQSQFMTQSHPGEKCQVNVDSIQLDRMQMTKGFNTQNAKKNIQDEMIDDDENLFEIEIKNLDTNEIYKMQVPVSQSNDNTPKQAVQNVGIPIAKIDLNYASKRKTAGNLGPIGASGIAAENILKENINGLVNNSAVVEDSSNGKVIHQTQITLLQHSQVAEKKISNRKINLYASSFQQQPSDKRMIQSASHKVLIQNFECQGDEQKIVKQLIEFKIQQQTNSLDKTSLLIHRQCSERSPDHQSISTVDVTQILDERNQKLLKEIYSVPQQKYSQEYEEYLPQFEENIKLYDDSTYALNFDDYEEFYDTFQDQINVKSHLLSNFMALQSIQNREMKAYSDSLNDSAWLIKNSINKHLGVEVLKNEDKHRIKEKFDKAALQLAPNNIKTELEAKYALESQKKPTFKDNLIGSVDFMGIYLVKLQDHHVQLDERSFFSKMMWSDPQKIEKEAKIEAFMQIEWTKYQIWGVYCDIIGKILNVENYNQEEKTIREYIYSESLFGWFNPLIVDI
ncbi:UNKNOWN [Stylonychia lemnae]|uniref:Uncharacterized protein n=1 Tax=Stylonychia lemnae TaxID=5949 RepID=A0A078AL04_STYLE|nr:UNKNOWN [Stylonychia lemnae]|eukprot:CDW81523.1 UNKNOWN [Stylonychia lemnae]